MMRAREWCDKNVGPSGETDVTFEYMEAYAAYRTKELRDAILWALGTTDFAPRPDGAGPYWWRMELMLKAGFSAEDLRP